MFGLAGDLVQSSTGVSVSSYGMGGPEGSQALVVAVDSTCQALPAGQYSPRHREARELGCSPVEGAHGSLA